jgi:ABC-2 type transport system permease protein
MKALLTLLKREYWEHRGIMLFAPLAIGAIFTTVMLLAVVLAYTGHFHASITQQSDLSAPKGMLQFLLYSISLPYAVLLLVMTLNYSISCLFDDRKDGSILFWKSMPISETKTVLSKALAALILMPLCYWVVTLVVQLIAMIAASLVMSHLNIGNPHAIWHFGQVIGAWYTQLITLFIQAFWVLPFLGWFTLSSAYSKRAPFLYAIIPPVLIIIIEDLFMGTSYLWQWIQTQAMHISSIWGVNYHVLTASNIVATSHLRHSHSLLTQLIWPNLWCGVVVGIVFLALAVLLRHKKVTTI